MPKTESETGDEVGPTDNVVWVEKAKSTILEGRDELEPVQPFCFPPSSVSIIKSEPTDPKHIHPDLVRHSWPMENVNAEHPKDSRIGIWMVVSLREGHDV